MASHNDGNVCPGALGRPTEERTGRNFAALQFTWRGKVFQVAMNIQDRHPFEQALLDERKARTRLIPFGAALCARVIVVALLCLLTVLFPGPFRAVRRYVVTSLDMPTVEAWKPRLIEPKRSPSPKQEVAPEEAPVAAPTVAIPALVASAPSIKPIKTAGSAGLENMPDLSKTFAIANPGLPLGSSPIPNLKKPREEVQTGGFGDPNGVPDNARGRVTPNIPRVGDYDLPAGASDASGTGRSGRGSAVVASAGFGSGSAAPGRGSGGGPVHQGLFGDTRTTASSPKLKTVAESSPRSTPVEILFKPRPNYTDAARLNKIEGDVLLEVTFSASGTVTVLRVLKGLGYGLDDAAESAAREIRFRPAQQDGVPVDSTSVVHISFQLAY